MRIRLALALLLLPLASWGQSGNFDEDFEQDERWRELQTKLPAYPRSENFLPFKVSGATLFDFFIDAKSISIGTDGVVRYSLIAKSSSGALNVSYEGLRCSERQVRVYAYGRSDNSWSKARTSRWQALPVDSRNNQQTVLFNEYFCPVKNIIYSTEEAIAALKAGRHPRIQQLESYTY